MDHSNTGGEPPLPHGWIKEWDPNHNAYFYVDTTASPPVTTWVHPSSGSTTAGAGPGAHQPIHSPPPDVGAASGYFGGSAPTPGQPTSPQHSYAGNGNGADSNAPLGGQGERGMGSGVTGMLMNKLNGGGGGMGGQHGYGGGGGFGGSHGSSGSGGSAKMAIAAGSALLNNFMGKKPGQGGQYAGQSGQYGHSQGGSGGMGGGLSGIMNQFMGGSKPGQQQGGYGQNHNQNQYGGSGGGYNQNQYGGGGGGYGQQHQSGGHGGNTQALHHTPGQAYGGGGQHQNQNYSGGNSYGGQGGQGGGQW